MTGPVSSSRANSASAVSLGGVGGKGGGASGAMGSIAGKIAGSITAELKLAVDPDGRRGQGGSGQDLYDIEETANTLAADLGASPAERGQLGQALHKFAHEVASLLVAQPDSRAFAKIEHAVLAAAKPGAAANAALVVRMIDQTTASITGRAGGAS
jgi:hypothetical protein